MVRRLALALSLALTGCKSEAAFHSPGATAETLVKALADKDYAAAESCFVKDAMPILIAACNVHARADECANIKQNPCPLAEGRIYPDCNTGEVQGRMTDQLRLIAESHMPCAVTAPDSKSKEAMASVTCEGLATPEILKLRKEGRNWKIVPTLPLFPVTTVVEKAAAAADAAAEAAAKAAEPAPAP